MGGEQGQRRLVEGDLPVDGSADLVGFTNVVETGTPLTLPQIIGQQRAEPRFEVAARLLARPGSRDYGSLAVLHGLTVTLEKEMELSPNCFFPVPNVESTFVRITPLAQPAIEAGELSDVERVASHVAFLDGGRIRLHGMLDAVQESVRLLVFDFEDVMMAAPVQDIAVTLFYNRTRPDYLELRSAFEVGYRSLRVWPAEYDGQLELLMEIGRAHV